MCYYSGIKVTKEDFIWLKGLEKEVANYPFLDRILINGFDYGKIPVLKRTEGKEDFDIVEMEWGFLPSYVNTTEKMMNHRRGYAGADGKFRPPLTTLNAMSEEMLKPGKMFRSAALTRRCLVLSSGFYEWRHVFPMGKKGQPLKTAVKYPHHIAVKDRKYFYMAGIWSPVTYTDTGEYAETVAIITTAANPLMEKIHNSKKRMPTILTDDLAYEWLFGDLSEERISEIAQYQFPAEQMEACTIAKDFLSSVDPTAHVRFEELEALDAGADDDKRQASLFG